MATASFVQVSIASLEAIVTVPMKPPVPANVSYPYSPKFKLHRQVSAALVSKVKQAQVPISKEVTITSAVHSEETRSTSVTVEVTFIVLISNRP